MFRTHLSCRILLSAITEALGPEAMAKISASCLDHTSFLRLNYYPVVEDVDPPSNGAGRAPAETKLGIGRHTDSGVEFGVDQFDAHTNTHTHARD